MKHTIVWPDVAWKRLAYILAIAFPLLGFLVPNAGGGIFGLFILAGLGLALLRDTAIASDWAIPIIIAFCFYPLTGFIGIDGFQTNSLPVEIIKRDTHFLAGVFILLALHKVKLPESLLELGLILAGILLGVVAAGQVLVPYFDMVRASGATISVVFGHLAAAVFSANLALLWKSRRFGLRLYLLAVGLSLLALVLSGTRGAFLSAVIVAIVFFALWVKEYRSWKAASFVLLGVVVSLFLVSIMHPFTGKRLIQGATDVMRLDDQSRNPENISIPSSPACLNEKPFLEWLIERSEAHGQVPLRITIEEMDSSIPSISEIDCPTNFAITLTIPSQEKSAWIYFPDRNVPRNTDIGAAMIVSGKGMVGLGKSRTNPREPVSSESPYFVELGSAPADDDRILAWVKDGYRLQLIPVAIHSKEYASVAYDSSFGLRLLMWEFATEMFYGKPFLGYGPGAFKMNSNELASDDGGLWIISRFDHPHSDYLTVASERGVVGLLALFVLFLVPVWFLAMKQSAGGVAGIAFVGSFMISGVSETMFNHTLVIITYVMMVSLFITSSQDS